ncbi:MAG TPA: VOC family protein [Kofleriaceae bacterium]|nr:VOC family protein [Kofleriaceae bacterium]
MAKAKAKAKPAAKKSASKKPAKAKPAGRSLSKSKAAAKTAAKKPAKKTAAAPVGPYLRSLRTCIYQVHDLPLAKEFYSQALGKDPYFDEPYYVGFDVDGHELGLDPDTSKRPPGGSGVIGYWRVEDINAAWQHLTTIGARSIELPHSVGVDLQVSIVSDPFGNYIGLIQGA